MMALSIFCAALALTSSVLAIGWIEERRDHKRTIRRLTSPPVAVEMDHRYVASQRGRLR